MTPTSPNIPLLLQKARKALDLIEQNGLEPDVRNYEIWYAYAQARDRALVSAIDAIISRNGSISGDDMGLIYKNHSPSGQVSETSAKAGERLANELDGACEMLEVAIGTTRDYGQSLEAISGDLNSDSEKAKLIDIVTALADRTRRAVDENRILEANLRESRNEMNALRETLEAVRTQSLTDVLTGVANRRHFDNVLQEAVDFALERRSAMSLMMLDIDYFKLFNDTHGHRAGDQVLRLVAATVRQNLPREATVARYGGEEFAVVMPGIRTAQAKPVADRIRRMLSAKDLVKVSSGESLGRVTASVGIAEVTLQDTMASLIERADRCLYAAKRSGRDRTIGDEVDAAIALMQQAS